MNIKCPNGGRCGSHTHMPNSQSLVDCQRKANALHSASVIVGGGRSFTASAASESVIDPRVVESGKVNIEAQSSTTGAIRFARYLTFKNEDGIEPFKTIEVLSSPIACDSEGNHISTDEVDGLADEMAAWQKREAQRLQELETVDRSSPRYRKIVAECERDAPPITYMVETEVRITEHPTPHYTGPDESTSTDVEMNANNMFSSVEAANAEARTTVSVLNANNML